MAPLPRKPRGLQVQARAGSADAFGCDRVDIALTKEHVVDAFQLDCAPILWLEQDPITDVNGANVGPHGNDASPREFATDLGGCRDDDAATAAPLSILGALANEDSVVQQRDGN